MDLHSRRDKLSAGTKQMIEQEVRRLIEESRVRATTLLETKRKELDNLAMALVDYETLNKDEAFKVLDGAKLPGRLTTSSGRIKVPAMGKPPLNGGEIPNVPQIPGSTDDDGSGGETPPSAVA